MKVSRGFTLVEIMLVVIIIGVLAAMVVPRFAGRTQEAKVARARSDIASIGLALDMYELDTGVYPETTQDLVTKPSGDSDTWKGPYIKQGKKGLIDPWSHEYDYTRPTEPGQDYVLKSLGPDGKPGNDDISNVEE
jgi:general secretion pathway protein G